MWKIVTNRQIDGQTDRPADKGRSRSYEFRNDAFFMSNFTRTAVLELCLQKNGVKGKKEIRKGRNEQKPEKGGKSTQEE